MSYMHYQVQLVLANLRVTAASLLCIILLAMDGGPALAQQINYLAQSRSVIATAFGGNQTAIAADFGPFSRDVSQDATVGPSHAYGRAKQISALESDRITMSGTTQGQSASGSGGGYSTLTVSFELAQSTPFTVSGFGSDSSLPHITSSIRIYDDTQTFLNWSPRPEFSDSLNQSGILPPGQYTFAAQFTASGGLSSSYLVSNDYSAQLQLPEPAFLGLLV